MYHHPFIDMAEKFYNLEQLLDRIEKSAKDNDRVSLEVIVNEIRSRSFGPLQLLVGISIYFIVFICLIIAIGMPFMEFVPFSASAAGTILAAFGLALIAHDGLLALLAFILTIVTYWWMITAVH